MLIIISILLVARPSCAVVNVLFDMKQFLFKPIRSGRRKDDVNQ